MNRRGDLPKTLKLISGMDRAQLYEVLKYIPRDREFLCLKKYKFIPDEIAIQEKLLELEFEDQFLIAEPDKM